MSRAHWNILDNAYNLSYMQLLSESITSCTVSEYAGLEDVNL